MGQTIEYNSTYRGSGGGAAQGLTDARDATWQGLFQSVDMDFSPTAQDIGRWMPPLKEYEYDMRIINSTTDWTYVYNRNGSFLFTQLWDGSSFWAPACSRMTKELERLRLVSKLPQHQSNTMEVMVKHYGDSLPDSNNVTTAVWTYVHVLVQVVGGRYIDVFQQNCEQWFGAAAQVAIWPVDEPGPFVDWVSNGQVQMWANGSTVEIPPTELGGTSGGIRTLQADDGSLFSLWIVPSYRITDEPPA